MERKQMRGVSLIETLVVVAILGIALAISLPSLESVRRHEDLRRLGRQLARDAWHCRTNAMMGRRAVGLVFAEEKGRWYYQMVEDRDLDGVSRKDWLAGIDWPLGPRTYIEMLAGNARLGVPAGWRVPDPAGRGILPAEDGLRTGSAAIISFSPNITATPSSIFFNDGRDRMLSLRVTGATGMIRVLEWRHGWQRWHELPPGPM